MAHLEPPVSQPPHVDAVVHRQDRDECRPAIITRVNDDGSVNLTEFGPGGAVPYIRVVQDDVQGSWHWRREGCR